jgi:signal transduction histidine kinase
MRAGLPSASWALDALAVTLVVVIGEIEVWTVDRLEMRPLWAVLVALVAAPLVWRRRFPLGSLLAVGLVTTLYGSQPAAEDALFTTVALVIAVYSLGAYGSWSHGLIGVGILFAFYTVGAVVDNVREPGTRGYTDLLYVWFLFGGTWVLGRLIGSWRRQALVLAERTEELERAQAWQAEAAAAEERTRIARELHDVIAHTVSVMVVQAGAAEQLLDADPERARESLVTIQDSGQQAVVELRHLLGILRSGEQASLTPQPSLRNLDELARQARAGGLPVEIKVEGAPRALAPGVDLAAYRIVQEALTNTLRHAAASRADVFVRYRPDAIDIDVTDDGRPARDTRTGTGHGLVGMRERVAIYGGDFDAGPRPEGGFAVHARLPVGGPEP